MSIFVENCNVQNNNNVMIRFLNMIKEIVFFGTTNLHFYTRGCTKNNCEHTFNSLKLLYQEKNTFKKCYKIFYASLNAQVIQMFYENFVEKGADRSLGTQDKSFLPGENGFGTHRLLSRVPWRGRVRT